MRFKQPDITGRDDVMSRQSQRMETFKLSTDPDFVAKVRDVVGL
jgi:hypothetical protein